jgi:hypothetical protein
MKVFVTGPQRSGTTFVSQCIAHDLGIPHVDEMAFDVYYFDKFLQAVEGLNDWVVHGPALLHKALDVQKQFVDVLFVVVRRDIEEIIRSQERINWSDKEERESLGVEGDPRPISVIKYDYWDQLKPQLTNWSEFEYESLKTHELWVDKEHRANFTSKQWQVIQ